MIDGSLIFALHAVQWIAIIVLTVLVFALARQIGLLHERIQPAGALMINPKLKVGDTAPSVDALNLVGNPVAVGRASSRSSLIMFISPTCPMCKSLLPIVRKSETDEKDWLDVYYASDGEEEHRKLADQFGIQPDQYLISEALGRSFGVSKLPYAVLIGTDGSIQSMGLVNSREHIESLFNAKESGVVSIQNYMNQK